MTKYRFFWNVRKVLYHVCQCSKSKFCCTCLPPQAEIKKWFKLAEIAFLILKNSFFDGYGYNYFLYSSQGQLDLKKILTPANSISGPNSHPKCSKLADAPLPVILGGLRYFLQRHRMCFTKMSKGAIYTQIAN